MAGKEGVGLKRPKAWSKTSMFGLVVAVSTFMMSGCSTQLLSKSAQPQTSTSVQQVADATTGTTNKTSTTLDNGAAGSKSENATTNDATTNPPTSTSTNPSSTAAKTVATLPTKPASPPTVQLGDSTPAASSLNEAMSLLGYLPLAFHPAHGVTVAKAMDSIAANPDVPVPGSYTFHEQTTAQQLSSNWAPLKANVITEGAVMRFELDHHLAVDGVAGPHVWSAIKTDLAQRHVTKAPYVFITVDEHPTEVLKVWKSGKVVLSTPANTGIAQSPTSIGTWPIYLRFQSQEMKGTTPWGTTYDDPGVPYVNYFHGGDAVHGFPRQSYGYPQSLGCVEIPIPTAKTVYGMVNYGTLVTVRK